MGDGTRTAVEAVLAAGEDWDEAEPELDLGLPAPTTAAGRTLVEERRGPGRPKGARNKRTAQTVERLLSRFEDPRAVLLAIAQTPVDELAATLGCSALQALQERRLAAIGVLPYVAQRQPISVDVTNRQVVHLTIIEGELAEATDADDGLLVAQVVQALPPAATVPETDEE